MIDVKLLAKIAIGMLILAPILPFPYGFYTFLRIVICCSAGYIAGNFFNNNNQASGILFAGIAFLFNPIIPIYLSREVWLVLDWLCAGVFVKVLRD